MDDANAVEAAGVPTSALHRINLSSSDIRQSVSLLKQACLDSGFFYVINHGIGQDLMEEVFAQSRRFFGLPLGEKMKLLRNEKHRGYTPLLIFFDKSEILGKPFPILRLLHYECLISDPSKGIYGAGAHSDFGFITLLATDDVSGLQICKNKDAKPQAWEYVQPLKGAFIVNFGD
ncbi:hypothetical protein EUGRSUZ_C03753, partial [Eucalyptus grandis]